MLDNGILEQFEDFPSGKIFSGIMELLKTDKTNEAFNSDQIMFPNQVIVYAKINLILPEDENKKKKK